MVYEPKLSMIIQRESNRHSAPRTVCTLAFELHENGSSELLMDCRSDSGPLDKVLACYIVEQFLQIGTQDRKKRINWLFQDLAGASRYNL